jgi:DegV family protein with EDD domain
LQIVTDSGTDLCLPREEIEALNISIVPLVVSLEGKSYREGIDISAEGFYHLLEATTSFPTTSQPSPADFAETYKRLASSDPDILSIHMSSGLSGTYNAARLATQSVPEANVTLVDTRTLSASAGWQVIAAARAIKAGWPKQQILDLVARVSSAADTVFTLNDLKYLIHGGRIGHMKGLIASVLNIKPIIQVDKTKGVYVQAGQARTFKKAVENAVDLISRKCTEGSVIRVQILHAVNPEGAEMLRELIDKRFSCQWLPTWHLSLVLGAHTGTSMVGVAFAPISTMPAIP